MKHIMWDWGVNPVVIPNGIPVGMIRQVSPTQVRALREAVGPAALLFKMGRFSPDKRWHQAVAAVARLKARGTAVKLLMRGGLEPFGGEVLGYAGFHRLRVENLEEPVRDVAGLASALRAHSEADLLNVRTFLPDAVLPALYAAATATLANSGHEPFGLVGLEAMACGGVAFVGATGEDYAQPFKNAVVIETDAAAEVVAYLTYLDVHPAAARQLRVEARRTAREFTWNRAIDILLRRLEFVALRQGLDSGRVE
jgi:glycosyltransferase involved in cell wall biosynthesis